MSDLPTGFESAGPSGSQKTEEWEGTVTTCDSQAVNVLGLDDLDERIARPKAYILMGNFCSRSFVPTSQGVRDLRDYRDQTGLGWNRTCHRSLTTSTCVANGCV